jgi:hypothetical protein
MLITVYNRCFPHVVNIAVQTVLGSITTNRNLAEEEDFGFPQQNAPDIIAIL